MIDMRIKISPQLTFDFQLRRYVDALFQYPRSYYYIREHRLWDGFHRYPWVTILLALAGAYTALQLLGDLAQWFSTLTTPATTDPADFTQQQKGLARASGLKYLTLVLVEVIIFHSVNRAIQLQRGLPPEAPTFRQFLRAQYRMILVSLRSWLKEIIATAILSAVCGFLGLPLLKALLLFIVQAYYVGFAMLDNYNERLGLSLTQSAALTRRHADVALGVGTVVYFLLLIPLVGTLIGPLLGGVTATLVLHRYLDPDHHPDYDYQTPTD